MEYIIPNSLAQAKAFSRSQFEIEMKKEYGLNKQQLKYDLQKKLDHGIVIRTGWNQYVTCGTKKLYRHSYSEDAKEIASIIENNFYDTDFQIFELRQLNRFANHLIAHNVIFVSTDYDIVDFVFDILNKQYPGKVLLKPSLVLYDRYKQDDGIVVSRLPSESPKGFDSPWQVRLERILVDMLVDKFISGIIPEGEKPIILNNAYRDYLIDELTMIRYAKRKGAEEKLRKALSEYGKMVQK